MIDWAQFWAGVIIGFLVVMALALVVALGTWVTTKYGVPGIIAWVSGLLLTAVIIIAFALATV